MLQPQVASREDASLDPVATPLTARELEIVRLVVDGLSNRAIAERLGISPRTVQAHIATAMRKTRVYTRTQLAVSVLREGLVQLVCASPGTPPAPSA